MYEHKRNKLVSEYLKTITGRDNRRLIVDNPDSDLIQQSETKVALPDKYKDKQGNYIL